MRAAFSISLYMEFLILDFLSDTMRDLDRSATKSIDDKL